VAVSTKEILIALESYYKDARQWAFFKELRVGTGYRKSWAATGPEPDNPEQRIDAWAINCYESKGFEKIAFEIKVSRSDYLHEIANPQKRYQAMNLCNRFYFAVPLGLVKVEELPEECGLVEVDESGNIKWTKRTPWKDANSPTWSFLAALARRIIKTEKEVPDVTTR
jgi:hypothetical protein